MSLVQRAMALRARPVAARAILLTCLFVLSVGLCCAGSSVSNHSVKRTDGAKPLLLTHYMPWFQSKPFSGSWGWHWTMNHYDPDHVVNGRRDAPSHYYPLLGLYDSNDPDTLQTHVMLMKLAGIDGVLIDWYGNDNVNDFGTNNRNSEALIKTIRRAGMHYAIVYETHTVPTEISAGFLKQADVVTHGQKLMLWMQQNFFSDPAYVRLAGRPVLLSFGDPYYNAAQWVQIFSVLKVKPMYFTESNPQVPPSSIGGFDWPMPGGGTAGGLQQQLDFLARAKKWPYEIACGFPRFDDIYAQAGVSKSWGHIDDNNGQTFTTTLDRALASPSPIVQLVTWNDWGEGTQIEPSVEFGYRDLEAIQRARHNSVQRSIVGNPKDLRLPVEWYALRKKYAADPVVSAKLAIFFPLVISGKMPQARALLARYDR